MPEKYDEQQVAVARVYARALLDLAVAKGEENAVLEEFDAIVEQFERQPQFEPILGDRGVDEAERAAVLERVLRTRANDLVVNTLQVMNRKGRAGLFRPLIQAYREELVALQGFAEATTITAVPLSESMRARLTEALASYTGKKIVLKESVDDSLIGGMILRLGDQKIDTSVARELFRVGARLQERASEELHTAAMLER